MKQSSLIPLERIENSIYLIRGEKVMLDRDLAELYGVTTKALNQAIKRHADSFPLDFMFQLTKEETMKVRLRSQSVTLKRGQHYKYDPHAFTEHGILMLSSALRCERAIQVNIEIMRAFVKLRQMLASNTELSKRLVDERRDCGDITNCDILDIEVFQTRYGIYRARSRDALYRFAK